MLCLDLMDDLQASLPSTDTVDADAPRRGLSADVARKLEEALGIGGA